MSLPGYLQKTLSTRKTYCGTDQILMHITERSGQMGTVSRRAMRGI